MDLSRREFALLTLATAAGVPYHRLARGARSRRTPGLNQQLLELADRYERQRRERFAAVRTRAELEALQATLRTSFLDLLGGLPERDGPPPARRLGEIQTDDGLVIEKLVLESFPGYFVTALLYRPRKAPDAPVPGVLSPCGHSDVGKAAETYQILHVNLARQGHVVLTYDPVGQGERSQFWDDAAGRSKFNLFCGEHAVLGNPLYLLGSSLARFRVWDGIRALDYLLSRPEVDPARAACVGNSGGGNLTAYLGALDPRIAVAAPCCYITALPRRMANRIQEDPDADPEQDIFGFVEAGIDHAGLLALRAPKPTLLGTARFDFFPIEGARATFDEAHRLFEVLDAGDRIARVEAPLRHGLSAPLRRAVYEWFARWLHGAEAARDVPESPVTPRSPAELQVCDRGQVSLSFRSRPLLPMALEEFQAARPTPRRALREVLAIDPSDGAQPAIRTIASGSGNKALVVCVNGNETPDWNAAPEFVKALERAGHAVACVDPRGVGTLRDPLEVRGKDFTDPLSGVEENLAYNAFLLGRSLIGLRAADVVAAVRSLVDEIKPRPSRVVLCARADAALVAACAAALSPAVDALAVERLPLSYLDLFRPEGRPINAASIVPNLLRDYGDVPDLLKELTARRVRVLVSAGVGGRPDGLGAIAFTDQRVSTDPRPLIDWLQDGFGTP